ncbi:hypothetical protein GGR57DRAFT_509059 [Xylariaceae sp. FL1272]|nr:hypothetical protein GGR57DRAFT_509059 [Xylariaceae sp. FL1272]
MAQGAPKKTTKPAMQSRANKPQQPKKGARVAKSKKSTAADKLQRRLAAGIVNKTERLLGERAGHLELIGPGKKARGQTKDDKDAKATKGGSRKVWCQASQATAATLPVPLKFQYGARVTLHLATRPSRAMEFAGALHTGAFIKAALVFHHLSGS